MYFTDFEAFLLMGGHGLYVWLCYGVGLFVFTVAFVSPILRKRAIFQELRQIQRRKNFKQTSSELHVN